MKCNFINTTTALTIALAPIGLAPGINILIQVPAYAQSVDPIFEQNLSSAQNAFELAKNSLADAQSTGEGVEAAQQAFDAANSELAAAVSQLKQAEAAATKGLNEQKQEPSSETQSASDVPKVEEAAPTPTIDKVEEVAAPTEPTNEAPDANARKKKKKQSATTEPSATEPIADKSNDAETAVKSPDKKSAEEVAPAAPSADAPIAKELATEPIDAQIKQAEETAPAVVPDNVTEKQKKALRSAENRRRDKAKEDRLELLGAAAVGVAVGVLLPALGGRVVEDQGDRLIVERDGEYYVRKDESALFRDRAQNVEIENLRGGRTLETVYRRDGSRIETVRDAGGYVLRRVKITTSGHEYVLFDSRDLDDRNYIDYDRELPPIKLRIPQDQYVVSGGRAGRRSLAEVFRAEPVEQVRQQYTLREVRENRRLRAIVRSVDLDTLTFESGSATVRTSQVSYLADIAGSMIDTVDINPEAVFLIEGHTDAVGSDLSNLSLSDRRAETVARILVEAFEVPPENLITQGYGEQYLKIDTDGDERQNRRVTIRNISPLLKIASQ